jgi:D-alanyl-D-alanine-carboxypeptidase/D-alanyl-D-alanine-endopeptidase
MADRGDVKLDDPVKTYLPASVKVPDHNGKQITLFDLATQSSGLPFNADNMTGKDSKAEYESYSAQRLYTFLGGYHLVRDPGAEFGYSNVGMSLLGHALARQAGTTYESLIIDRICRPLKMESTCIHPSPQQMSRLAMGHDESGNPSPPWKLDIYEAAGAVHSTTNDLLNYAAAQVGLTTSEISASIEKTHIIRHIDTVGDLPGNGTFGQTAMCWVDRGALQPPGMQLLAHAGGAGSYHAWVGFDTKQHRGVVVLSTDNQITVEAIGFTLLQHKPLTAQSAKEFDHELVGIGVALDMNKLSHALSITKVFPNSAAAEAGLTAGMTIHKIGDAAVDGKSLDDCLALLRGQAGSKVRLELSAPDGSPKSIELIRKKFLVGTT